VTASHRPWSGPRWRPWPMRWSSARHWEPGPRALLSAPFASTGDFFPVAPAEGAMAPDVAPEPRTGTTGPSRPPGAQRGSKGARTATPFLALPGRPAGFIGPWGVPVARAIRSDGPAAI
jgi:hypothetical protein